VQDTCAKKTIENTSTCLGVNPGKPDGDAYVKEQHRLVDLVQPQVCGTAAQSLLSFPLRRIQRDVSVRGRDVAGVLKQYTTFVKPSYETFVAPSRRHADVIIPWAKDANEVAIELITEHIRSKLKQPDLRYPPPPASCFAALYPRRPSKTRC